MIETKLNELGVAWRALERCKALMNFCDSDLQRIDEIQLEIESIMDSICKEMEN